ncbi:SAM-dependent methyltransferase [Kiloniella laminariae]|uniref:SAM-dependent methyltransferase n=1 Tax=Kiloniella laminariae TaxID=454162 RepID=UPI00035F286E|nr:cyclopropane-fatty-acyl-phospholipid synthase family protein [Kiloniella laminariae]
MSFLQENRFFKHTACDGLGSSLALWLLSKIVRSGRLEVTLPKGAVVELGDGSGNICGMTLPTLKNVLLMFLRPDPSLPNAFVAGKWWVTKGELEDLIFLLLENEKQAPCKAFRGMISRIKKRFFHLRQYSPVHLSSHRVRHHYDLGNRLYRAFLDPEMFYSCAFFEKESDDLERAQKNKVCTTLERLALNDKTQTVLDIGSGWGGLTRALALASDAEVTGITLSREQFELANLRKEEIGEEKAGKLVYELCDYRQHREGESAYYDRIVSVGMYEHVGMTQYRIFFDTIFRLLKQDGRAVVHSIVRRESDTTSRWIDQNIFPGGYIPAISEMIRPAEEAGLNVEAVYSHAGENYARTLRFWRERFRRAKTALAEEGYDEEFCRMWEFYLGACINSFDARQENLRVAQVVFTKALL